MESSIKKTLSGLSQNLDESLLVQKSRSSKGPRESPGNFAILDAFEKSANSYLLDRRIWPESRLQPVRMWIYQLKSRFSMH